MDPLATDPITEHLNASLEQYLADLHELVAIDSGTPNKQGVDAVASAMETRLRELGCETERLPHPVYGDSVVGRLRGAGSRKVVMVGHTDTVYPDGTATEHPFNIRDDRAYGPGTADMKGCILAGLYAMRALRACELEPYGELVLFLNPDEEIGSPSSKEAIDRECEGATAALVLEGALADGSVVIGRKGVSGYKLTVHGRSAHAGVEPHRGRSAIHELAHKVVALVGLNGLSEGTTVNVGAIHGGTRSNVVAELAGCDVDVRVTTVRAREELDREARRVLSEPTIPDTRIEVESHHGFPPMERNERNERLFETARTVAARLGLELRGAESGGGSDANHISALGVPVLDGLGPVGSNKHNAEEESLHIPSFVERTALLSHLIVELSGSDRVGD
jgi:glutamate carboxypeptidase